MWRGGELQRFLWGSSILLIRWSRKDNFVVNSKFGDIANLIEENPKEPGEIRNMGRKQQKILNLEECKIICQEER